MSLPPISVDLKGLLEPLSKSVVKLIETAKDYIAVRYEPTRIRQEAEAEADAARIRAQAQVEVDRIIAEGESQKAQIRVSQEKEQIEKLINAETEMKEAEIRKKTEQAGLEADKLKAKRIEVIAAAEANKKRKIMLADGALDKKLATFEKVHENYAKAIKGSQIVPSVVIGGDSKSGGKNATDLVNLLTAKTAMDLGLKLKPTK